MKNIADFIKIIIAALGFSIAIFTVHPTQAQADSSGHFEAAPCPFNNISEYAIDCGWLFVPENHADPASPSIQIPVVILRSPNPRKAPDPLLYLGNSVVENAPIQTYRFAPWLRDRDVILTDQRGTGLSQPQITCIPYDDAIPFIEGNLLREDVRARMADCREQLAEAGINPDFYNTQQTAADFAALRLALGYQQINIYGISYGTRVGLVMLRDYPEGIRSAVLDSVLPPQVSSFVFSAQAFERAFSQMESACQRDFVCRTVYPNLRESYESTYQQLQESPLTLEINGKVFSYNGDSFASSVSGMLVNQPGMAGLTLTPAFITDMANGEYRTLEKMLEPFFEDDIRLPDIGHGSAIACADEAATTTLANIRAETLKVPEAFRPNLLFGEQGYHVCEMWGMPPAMSTAPAVSDIPTLLLSGQLDPTTPVEWAREAGQTLSHSRHIEFPSLGHNTSQDSCVQQIIVSFIDHPEASPDTACIASMSLSPTVTLTFHATRPLVRVGAFALAVVSLIGLGSAGLNFARAHDRVAWRATFKKSGWWPLAISLGGIMLLLLNTRSHLLSDGVDAASAVQIIVPLVIAVQAASVFSPDDEPGLEMLLALPRPISWLVGERLAVIFLSQSAVALVGIILTLLSSQQVDPLILLFGWLPSALFLSGIALYVSLRTRLVMLGMVVAGFLWMVFGLFADMFLPGGTYSFPLNIVQPFLWAFHVHIAPGDLAQGDYWINRLFLAGAGIALMMLAFRQVRDSEQILLNVSRKGRRKTTQVIAQTTPESGTLKPALTVTAVSVNIQPLRQWLALVTYEFKMHWRRRAFKVLTLTALLSSGFVALVLGTDLNRLIPALPSLQTLPADQFHIAAALTLVAMVSGLMISLMTFVLPLLVADTVPLDRQYQMDDLLGSLPLSQPVYLLGKVAGVWLAGWCGLAISMAALAVLWLLRNGIFHPAPFVDLLLVNIVLVAINGGMGVLIGATQPTRRRAVLVAIAALITLMLLPGRMDVLTHFVSVSMEGLITPPVTLPSPALTIAPVQQALLIGVAELVVVGISAWLIRLKGNTQ